MSINIQLDKIDQEQFRILTSEFYNQKAYLITPKSIKVKWTTKNLKYRSSMWTERGEPISLGLPKFFNWAESPDLRPSPSEMEAVNVVEKIDGSCLIVSPHPTNPEAPSIVRTRGTFSAFEMPNGKEIYKLQQQYPAAFNRGTDPESYIFEWISPDNQIIIPVDKPDIRLIAVVRHEDYSLYTQDELDALSEIIKVPRPRRFNFDTPEEMIEAVAEFEGTEGVCVYYNNDQWIRKIKSTWYLALHRMKSDLGTLNRVIEVYFALGKPTYQEFMERIGETFDYEVIKMARGHISRVCDAVKEVNKIVAGMQRFVEKVKPLLTRKEQAQQIISSYGKTNRASFVFNLLDGKELEDDQIKKLVYQMTA